MIRALALGTAGPAPDAEALALFQTLGELSAEATASVEAGDGETLLRILAERARIMERAGELIARVMAASAATQRGAAARAPDSLIEAARELATLDAGLRVALEAQRDALGRDLNALESGGAARSAYGGIQRGRDTINVMR